MKNHLQNTKDKIYIYESPDKGKTVYRREFLSDNRVLVYSSTDEA